LTTSKNWNTQVPLFIDRDHPQLVIAMWEWDNSCILGVQTTGACPLDPTQYTALLMHFIATVLAPGDGVSGLMFEQYPPLGPLFSASQEVERVAGEDAWDRLVASMAPKFPGRVMYLPVGSAVDYDGHFSTWLPPEGNPSAPQSSWVRVRMLDNTHFCPAGAGRYAAALLSDLTSLYRLGPPSGDWSTGIWTDDTGVYTEGSCPDDHP
jgi:hypothetical protein